MLIREAQAKWARQDGGGTGRRVGAGESREAQGDTGGTSGGYGSQSKGLDPAFGGWVVSGRASQRRGCVSRRIKGVCQMKKRRKVFQVGGTAYAKARQ